MTFLVDATTKVTSACAIPRTTRNQAKGERFAVDSDMFYVKCYARVNQVNMVPSAVHTAIHDRKDIRAELGEMSQDESTPNADVHLDQGLTQSGRLTSPVEI